MSRKDATILQSVQLVESGYIESGYTIKWNLNPDDLGKVYRLRAKIFCGELRWVGRHCGEIERDEFDTDATHIAVFDTFGDIVATLRLIRSSSIWMIDKYFADLIPPDHMLRRQAGICEISRLAVDPRAGSLSIMPSLDLT